MNKQKNENFLSVVLPSEFSNSQCSQNLMINQDQQDEETSDCPLLTPSPPICVVRKIPEMIPVFKHIESPLEIPASPTSENINSEDGLNVFMNIVNSSSKPLHDEPSSRDPMVESTSSSSNSSIKNEPVCTQLLTQLNEAYQHLAPDAQALENGGKPPLVGIQLVVPKPPKNYIFTKWNWPLIRKTCFWSLMSILAGCAALVIGVIITMPKRCDPQVEWWQGSLFYEIFPGSYQDGMTINDGVGDLPGINKRLGYLQKLGVKGVRLNSIFPADHYPEYYSNITSLMDVNPILGEMKDFDQLLLEIHKRNMTLILDIPLYPFIKDFDVADVNETKKILKQRRDISPQLLPTVASFEIMGDILTTRTSILETVAEENDEITLAIKFWTEKGVDGFYLKGLENYVNEKNFPNKLRLWKSIIGTRRILICNIKTLNEAKNSGAKNAILNRIDLIDVHIGVANGTNVIREEIDNILNGILFEKAGYPWVHWSIGNIDTKRVSSTLSVNNASIAVALMTMMLPGTPSIFYGDEKGLLECDCPDHADLEHVHNLMPMRWDKNDVINDDGASENFSSFQFPWLSKSNDPIETNLDDAISNMTSIRRETPTIYVKALITNDKPKANCDVRYTRDELIVIERRYRRRNSYVFVANLGKTTQNKDLSNLYYGGHMVIGPKHKFGKNVYFKQLNIPPGEAFVIKLDK
ncbi:neutral and basic amino acid transport protein rBAT-like isoform X2 [Leptopilina boulardi]|uniref:neutral and basic amino acid transport protein rBAT-like isoform X2 n=1 Tax=Leptopilina boulardi TaxID=63433 RepID=UPI0021F62CCB|nr:neutral and basic amino acid transport protein rBAT-like isoform X2 [Leptopilina boulardi]